MITEESIYKVINQKEVTAERQTFITLLAGIIEGPYGGRHAFWYNSCLHDVRDL